MGGSCVTLPGQFASQYSVREAPQLHVKRGKGLREYTYWLPQLRHPPLEPVEDMIIFEFKMARGS